MGYEDQYNEARSRYYNACSQVNECENRATALRSQRQQKLSYMNQLKAELKRHRDASLGLVAAMEREAGLRGGLSRVAGDVDLASENLGSMASSSTVRNKSLNEVYGEEASRTRSTLDGIFSTLRSKKAAIDGKVLELQENVARAESELQDVESGIRSADSSASDWKRERWNASMDMEYYRRKTYEEE